MSLLKRKKKQSLFSLLTSLQVSLKTDTFHMSFSSLCCRALLSPLMIVTLVTFQNIHMALSFLGLAIPYLLLEGLDLIILFLSLASLPAWHCGPATTPGWLVKHLFMYFIT